jgi:hypothetical protein
METYLSSETLVTTYKKVRCHNPEDYNMNTQYSHNIVSVNTTIQHCRWSQNIIPKHSCPPITVHGVAAEKAIIQTYNIKTYYSLSNVYRQATLHILIGSFPRPWLKPKRLHGVTSRKDTI